MDPRKWPPRQLEYDKRGNLVRRLDMKLEELIEKVDDLDEELSNLYNSLKHKDKRQAEFINSALIHLDTVHNRLVNAKNVRDGKEAWWEYKL